MYTQGVKQLLILVGTPSLICIFPVVLNYCSKINVIVDFFVTNISWIAAKLIQVFQYPGGVWNYEGTAEIAASSQYEEYVVL